LLLEQTGQPTQWAGLSVIDWTLLLIIVGCLQSIWIRLARILQALAIKKGH
jgi:hypothetical protein